MSSCGIPVSSDSLGINLIFICVSPQPPHRALHVFDTRQSRSIKSIVDRDTNISSANKINGLLKQQYFAFIATDPATTMNEHQRRPQPINLTNWPEQIQFPTLVTLAIRHVQLTDNLIAGPSLDLFVSHFLVCVTSLPWIPLNSILPVLHQTLGKRSQLLDFHKSVRVTVDPCKVFLHQTA